MAGIGTDKHKSRALDGHVSDASGYAEQFLRKKADARGVTKIQLPTQSSGDIQPRDLFWCNMVVLHQHHDDCIYRRLCKLDIANVTLRDADFGSNPKCRSALVLPEPFDQLLWGRRGNAIKLIRTMQTTRVIDNARIQMDCQCIDKP